MTHSTSPGSLGGLALGLVLSVQIAPAQIRAVGNTLVWGHPETTPGSGATSANPNGDHTPQPGARHFLSGKVMMDDGSAPPEPVAVERFCGAEVSNPADTRIPRAASTSRLDRIRRRW